MFICLCSYDLALISGALSELRDHFNLSEALEEAIVGAAKVGAFFGTFLGNVPPLWMIRKSQERKCERHEIKWCII